MSNARKSSYNAHDWWWWLAGRITTAEHITRADKETGLSLVKEIINKIERSRLDECGPDFQVLTDWCKENGLDRCAEDLPKVRAYLNQVAYLRSSYSFLLFDHRVGKWRRGERLSLTGGDDDGDSDAVLPGGPTLPDLPRVERLTADGP